MRWIMILLIAAFGIFIGMLGFIPSTWIDFSLLLLLGLGEGYVGIILITWMQTRAPKEMLGRIMSLWMLSSTGLVPVSQALAGVLSKWSLTLLFAIPGVLVLMVTVWMASYPDIKQLSASIATVPAER